MQQNTGIVNIKGKEYTTVAKRIDDFRSNPLYEGYQVVTEIVHAGDQAVIMKASIYDGAGRLTATGHAEEFRSASQINRTSALENAETSAIGRALATLGIGGTSFASAEEVARAIEQQQPASELQIKTVHSLLDSGAITKEHLVKVFGIETPEQLYAVEADRIINAFESKQQEQEA